MSKSSVPGAGLRWQILVLVLLLSTSVILLPLLRSTFVVADDVLFHLYNVNQYRIELQDGVLFPRWLGNWYIGYGAPIGISYAPLTYYAAALLGLLGLPTLTALKAVIWGSLLASGLFMYMLARQFMAPVAALLAALVYQILPQRQVNLYMSGVLTQYTSYVWLPLIAALLVLYVKRTRLRYFIALVLALSGLMLTHMLIAYIAAPPLIVFAAGLLIFRSGRERRLQLVIGLVSAAALAALLGAIYWLPALAEGQYLNVAYFTGGNGFGDFHQNFLLLPTQDTPRSFLNLGLAVSVALCLCALPTGLRRASESGMVWTMLIAGGLSAFMTTALSYPIWAIMPRADLIQFPSRWLTPMAPFAAGLAGLAADAAMQQLRAVPSHRRWRYAQGLLLIISIVACIVVSGYVTLTRGRHAYTETVASQVLETPLPAALYEVVYTEEHRPEWSAGFDYTRQTPVDATNGVTSAVPIKLSVSEWKSARRSFTVTTDRPATINVRTFWFPGWKVTTNGQVTTPAIRPEDGTLQFPVGEGTSEVQVVFEDMPIRSAAKALSGMAFLVLLALGWRSLSRTVFASRREKQLAIGK